MKPLVSVCVQTYNHEKYIKECLDGILMQQTTFPFEIVLGEDESADETRLICQEYAERHPDKIRLFLRSRRDVIYINGNPTGRYNFIENLKACTGKYIALCEGDDYWSDSLKLQKQVDVLEKNQHLTGCFHNSEERFWNDYTKASELYINFKKGFELTIMDLTKYNAIPTASVLFRNSLSRELFSTSFLQLSVGDWPLHLLNARKGNYYYIPQVMSVRNLNPNSLWGMKDQKQNEAKLVKMLTSLASSGWFNNDVQVSLNKTAEELSPPAVTIKKKDFFLIKYKKKLIGRLISLLNKL